MPFAHRHHCGKMTLMALVASGMILAPQEVVAQSLFSSDSERAAEWVRRSMDEVHGPRVRLAKDVTRRTVTKRGKPGGYGLQLLPACATADADAPLVIVIHGLNSSPARTWGLLPPEVLSQQQCGSFAYPNDQSLDESARFLSRELKRLRKQQPGCALALVTHSMGGLIARACIENPELDPGGVERLIMVAPPTHGSLLARIAVSPDVWEHWLARSTGTAWRRSLDATMDGLGEAASDLVPESPFLTRLNARQRAVGVEYTVMLGTAGGGVRPWQLSLARAANRELAERESSAAPWCDLADELVGDLDEVVRGLGDGAVAVKRGRLAGVDDTHLLDFHHVTVNNRPPGKVPTAVQALVAERLGVKLADDN
jgi:pimeloyl-ACP methyl ester carboxylesterase